MLLNLPRWVTVVFPLLAYTPCREFAQCKIANKKHATVHLGSCCTFLCMSGIPALKNHKKQSNKYGMFCSHTSRFYLLYMNMLSESSPNLSSEARVQKHFQYIEISRYFRLCRPYSVCWNSTTVYSRGSRQWCMNPWAWLCSSKSVYMDTGFNFISFSCATQYSFLIFLKTFTM